MKKKQLRVRGVRRKQVDEDKLAMAYLLLAKAIVTGTSHAETRKRAEDSRPGDAGARS